MKAESPRKCKICGGPNHYGCGCEAKRQANAMVDIENIHKAKQPESETQAPESETPDEQEIQSFCNVLDKLTDRFSLNDIQTIIAGEISITKDIKTMADGFEGLCACMYDTNNYLKLIAGDLITIRKFLTKEDEVKNADPDEPEKNQN